MGFTAPEFNECKVVNQLSDASGKPSTNPQVKCQHCEKLFRGGAFRIRGHLLGLSKRGVAGCPALVAAHFCVLMRAELEHLRLHPQQETQQAYSRKGGEACLCLQQSAHADEVGSAGL